METTTVAGINFGSAWGASGAMGFFGEGYLYHDTLEQWFPEGFRFDGVTFVAKTTTLEKRAGNMPLRTDGIIPGTRPVEFKPKCIHVGPYSWLTGSALNAVGLSGPGADYLLSTHLWQEETEPFFISFMAVQGTAIDRLNETQKFAELLMQYRNGFSTDVGLQINFSCPNVGKKSSGANDLVKEVAATLEILKGLEMPLMPKLTALTPIKAAVEISQHSLCDGLCVSNTIPFAELSIGQRLRYFGRLRSPLRHLGGGGVSGNYLRHLVVPWVAEFRDAGGRKHVNAGGGILHPSHVWALKNAGADSIFIGSVVFLRPWRLQAIIEAAHQALGED